jgi:hypothetical protein
MRTPATQIGGSQGRSSLALDRIQRGSTGAAEAARIAAFAGPAAALETEFSLLNAGARLPPESRLRRVATGHASMMTSAKQAAA